MRFLFVDQIIQSSPGQWIRGIKHITKEDNYLTLDDTGNPCFLSSLIGETLGQLAAWNVMAHHNFTLRPVAGVVSSAQLVRPAYVGETLLLESFIESLDHTAVQYNSIARVGEDPVFKIEGALGPLLPMIDFIDSETVQQQYNELNRPGDWEQWCTHSNRDKEDLIELENINYTSMTFDRIIDFNAGHYVAAEKRITRASSYFLDHFPRKPVLPMTVLLECIQHLVRHFVSASSGLSHFRVVELRKIKMNVFVQPGDIVLSQIKVKHQTDNELILSSRSEVDGKRVCVVDVVLNAKGN